MKHNLEKIIDALLWGTVFILVGVALLLNSLGVITFKLEDWWPAIFIVVGVNMIISGIVKAVVKD